MRLPRSVCVAALLVSARLHAQAPNGIPHPCLTMPEAHQFDFWIGEWDVTPWQVKEPTPAQRLSAVSYIPEGLPILFNPVA